MKNKFYIYMVTSSLLALAICLAGVTSAQVNTQTDKSLLSTSVQKAEEAAANSISFIENKGQWRSNVLFRADIPGGQMLATPTGMLIGKFDEASLGAISRYDAQSEELEKSLGPDMIAEKLGPRPKLKGHGWRFNFIGGSLASPQSMTKSGESHDYFNYLIGDVSSHATNVHSYKELVYKNVYQGVDVRYYTAPAGDLENDIIVHPGADTRLLQLRIEGIEGMKLNTDGSLLLPTTVGDIVIPGPVSYLQDDQGNTTKIDVAYQLTGSNQLSFKIPDYDRSKTLVIDPIVMRWACWITSSTGSSDGHNHGIDVDASGNIYTTGRIGTDMLVTTGAFQVTDSGSTNVFIAEYQEPATPGGAGVRVWQTYMGTEGGDNPYAMSLGLDGNLYITGLTSGNFQRTYGSGAPASSWATQRTCGTVIKQQAWVAKVSNAGTWALVREIGPATDNFTPQPYDIRVVPTGASTFDLVVVASVIQQSNAADGDIPAAIIPAGTAKTGTGDLNGYVFRISSDLNTIRWADQYTSSGNNNDQFNIANVDASGNIYVAGYTRGSAGISYNNPSGQTALVGTADGWLMKLTGSTGAALWSRYFNAAAGDTLSILCMELNNNGSNLILGGTTTGNASYNLTTATPYGGKGDFFVASVPATGAATNWGTYYGGSQSEYNMMGLNVDQNNDIYVLAYTYSKNIHAVDYPVQDSSYNTTTNDRQAIFFKLSGSTGDTVLYSTYLGGSGDDYDPIGERGIKFSNCRIYLCMTAASNDFPLTEGTLTPTKTSSNSTLDPMLISMSNPPDLEGNSITGGANQTITCGQVPPAQIAAGTASYLISTIIRNAVNETNGTKQAYPDGLPPLTNYQWQVSVDTGVIWTNVAGATSQNYTAPALDVPGLVEYRRIVDGDACSATSDTVGIAYITVSPTSPAPTVSNNSPLCAGQTLQLTADSVAGATYLWTGPNGFTSTLRNPVIANVSSAAAGVYQCIQLTSANGCTSYPSTTTVTITTQPAAPTLGGNSPLCTGQTLNLTATGATGATFAWTGPDGFKSYSADTSIVNVNSNNAGTYFAIQTLGSCASGSASIAIVVDTISSPTGLTASPNPICSGQTLTLTATATNGATLNWTFPDGGTASGSPVVRNNVTTAMGGVYSLTQTSGLCTSNPLTINVAVDQTPASPVATASPDSLCAGSQLTLTASGAAGATFDWTFPDGGGATGSPVIRTAVTAAMAGTYSVTQSVNGCTSPSAGTVIVAVEPLPALSVGSTETNYCSSGTLSLNSSVTGSSPFSYSWSGPDTFSRTQADPTRTNTVPAMSGNYTLTVTDEHGCTAAASTSYITVNGSPSVLAGSSNTAYCTGGAISLTATPSSGTGPYTYSWSGPNGFISVHADTTLSNITSASAGVYSVTVTDANGCTATASTASLVVHTSPSVSVSSLTPTYCSGATISLSSTVTGGTPSYTYSWSGPNSFASSQADPTIANSTAAMSGIYTLVLTDNNTCTTTASTSSILVYQSPSANASSTSSAYCAGASIVLSSSASGGSSPYSYQWSGPASFTSYQQDTTRSNITTAMSGVYTVVVTDSHSCSVSASTSVITVNPGFTVNASSNSPLCAGGTIDLSSSSTGGSSPFTYNWSATSFSSRSADTTRADASAAMAGVYSVTITDNNGCSNTASTTVLVNPATTISVTSNSAICVGNTLTLQATPSSGTSPYTYSWSGPSSFSSGISNPERTNSGSSFAGTYNVTVTDNNGCSGTGSTIVVVNPLPSVTAGSTSSGYCTNDTIELTALASLGTAPYVSYSWSGPSSYSSNAQNPSISNSDSAMSGTYTVTVTDSKGCSAHNGVSVAVYALPVVSPGAAQTTCSGSAVTLGGTPTASGGTPGYTYSWNNGAANTSNPSVSPLSTTIYDLTVTDSKSCSVSGSETITVNAKPSASAGPAQSIPSCSQVGVTIGGSNTASGGTGPYSYRWSPATGLSSDSVSNPRVVGIGSTTTYTVTVTDHNGCTATASVTVSVTTSTLASAITPPGPAAWCASGTSSVTLTANASGGAGGYTYSWTGTDLSAVNTSSTIADPSLAGTYVYTVTVKDTTGCQVIDTTSITVYPKPTANAGNALYTICHGDSVTIGGYPTGSGGTGILTYSWSNGAAGVADPVVSPTSNTTYTVTVSDIHSCSATASTNVNVNPATTINVSSNSSICSGDTLTLLATTLTGTGPYNYTWSGPASFSASISDPSVTNANSTNAGTYNVTVSDHNGCSVTGSTLVVINPLPAVSAGTTNLGYCTNSTIQLLANPSLGTPPYVSYDWSGPGSYSSNNQNPSIANADSAIGGTYTVMVTDSKGCSAQGSVSVIVYGNPIASAGANQVSCSGSSVVLGSNPTASGGTPPYNYTWNNGAANSSNPTVAPVSSTTYDLTVTDGNGCSSTASQTVSVNAKPTASAGPNQTIPSCSLVGTSIGGNNTASGGTGPYTYLWSPAAGLSSPDTSNPVVHGIGSTTFYTVTVTDQNGCAASASVTVNVTGSTLALNITNNGPTAWCAYGTSNVTLTANATGGIGGYTYSWSGADLSSNDTASTIVSPDTAGTYVYAVIITDSTGCQAGDTTSVTVYPLPIANAGNASYTICHGDSLAIGGYPTGSGGTGTLIYSWSNGAAPVADPVVSPSSNITYTVTVTDTHSCSATASTTVLVNPATTISVTSNSAICVGNTLTLQATPSSGTSPYTYSWSGPSSFSSGISNPERTNSGSSFAGTYNVTVTDNNGCSGTGSTIVVVNPLPSVTAGSTSSGYCTNDTIELTALASLGTAPYVSYSWSGPSSYSSNAQNPSISNSDSAMSGTYTVTVTDSKGCSAHNGVSVAVYALPVVSPGAAQTTCSGSAVTLGGTPTASGGTPGYTYSWNNGAANTSNPSVSPLSTTIYDLTVTDSKSCSVSGSETITVNAKPSASAGPAQSIPSCSQVGVTIGGSNTASGGTGPYSYRWSPATGLSSDSVSNPRVVGIGSTTTYTVTVTDHNGCTATASVTVSVTTSTLASAITPPGPTAWCASGTSSVTLTANASGGAGGYTYSWTGTDLSAVNTSSTIADPSLAGTYVYTVTVKDTTGCQVIDTTSITVYPKPTANAGNALYTICHGDSVTIGGYPTGSGGTGILTYSWSNGAAGVADPVVSPTSNTTYTVTVSDIHSCSATASTNVNVRSNPVASAGPNMNLPGCSPTGIQIGGSPTGSGGGGSYTYAWSPPGGLSSTSVSNPTVQGISSNQTYTVIVTDTNGCSSSAQVSVTVTNNPPTVNIFAGGDTAWCAGSGGSVFLAANVSGGVMPITYSWSGTSISPVNAPTAEVNPNSANTYIYNVTVTDAFNCITTARKIITVNPNPTASAGSANYTICNGDSVTIGGNPTGTGGTPGYTYTWSNGAAPVANPKVDPSTNTTYTVTVSDANSCSATAISAVTVRPDPIADAGGDKTMPGCSPTGLQIGGNPTASGGGGGPYTYAWSPAVGLSATTIANPTVTGLRSDTTYTVTVTDQNGCSASAQMVMHITSNTPSVNIASSGSTSWCAGTFSSTNLIANATGGTNPLTYAWSGTDIDPVNMNVATVYPNSAGQYGYTVTVTDGFNCTATATKAINVMAIPVASAGAPVQNICANTTVTIGGNPTGSGGAAPYTYVWSGGANGVSNPSVTPLISTTYNVTVTDSAGCSASASTTVLVSPIVNANAGTGRTIASCPNACAALGGTPTGSGGTGMLTYSWSPPTGLSSTTVPNPTACGLSGNTIYTVTVTDTAGCTATSEVSITVIASSLTAEAGTGGAFCAGSGDSVMLGGYPTAVGGTPVYTYTWSPTNGLNLVNPANPMAYPTSTTVYYLTVTDAQGCTAIDSSRVRVLQGIQVNGGTDTAVCEGSSVILGGNPTVTGGTGPYTYAWTPGTDVSNVTIANPLATPFTSTDYTVTATDGNGCKATGNMIVTVWPKPLAQAGSDQSMNACPLDSVVIGASPSATGGTLPYTYSWSPPQGLSSTSSPNPVVTGISSSHTYSLTVTDSFGCQSSASVLVDVVPSTLQAYQAATQQICSGVNSCIQLGGLPTVQGGVSPYIYSWSGTINNPSSSNPIACPSTNTTYDLTVTDSRGCSVTSSQTVLVNPSPVVSAGNDTAVCLGQSVVIGGSPTASGGVGGGYTYSWTPSIGITSSIVANPVSNATATTTYTVEVSDTNGCSSSGIITVTVRPVPAANAGPDKNISICSNDSVFIGNIPVASGGTAPYTYLWIPATGLSDSLIANPVVSGITHTTSYEIIVTDSLGCEGTSNVVVNVNQQTLQAEAGSVNVICASSNTPVTIGGYPSATGGTPPYVYNWAPAAGLSSTTVPNPIATVSTTTTYYLTVTDSKGCVSVDSIKIIQNPAPIANAGSDTALCFGFGKILGGNPTASGGTGSYQYSWTPTTGLNANNTSNPSAFPLTTTTYQVLVTDSNGCQAAAAVTIIINQNPTANAGADASITSCAGDSAQLGGTPTASGGSGGYIYTWSPGTGLSSPSASNPYVHGISSPTLYGLTVTDANGCSASNAVLISVIKSTLVARAGNDANVCAGNNTIVTLGGNPTPTGGTGPYTYVWSPASSLNSPFVSNPFANPAVTTGYSVTVTDSRGCIATDSVYIFVNPTPVVNAGTDTTICSGSSVAVGGNPTASGGMTPYAYAWIPTTGVNNIAASNPEVNPAISTTYIAQVTDAHGCIGTGQVTITVHQSPAAYAGPNETLVACASDSVRIGGTPSASGGTAPYTYVWSPATGVSSDSIPNPYVSHLGSSSNFTLVVYDQYGCSASSQMNVAVSNSTLFAEAGNNVTVCQGSTNLVILGGTPTARGGTPSYTYAWSPAAGLSSTTSPNPAALPAQSTVYTVVVTDGAGCIATDTMDFIINPKPIVNAGLNDTICRGACVTLGGSPTADGNQATNIYSWSPATNLNDPGLSNPTVCPAATNTYSVIVTNQYNCSASSSVTVKVNATPIVNAGASQAVESCPNACITLGGSPTASGGLAPYSYTWSPSLSLDSISLANPTLCDLSASTTYNVSVTDANGCSATGGVLIQSVPSDLSANAGADRSICAGQTSCITIGGTPSIQGGNGPYIVHWSPASSFCTSSTIPNPQVNPVDPTTYTMFVTDSKGCTAVDSVLIDVNPAVTAVVSPDTSVCWGAAATLGGYPSTGSGGTPPYTYSWSPTIGISSPNTSNPTVTTIITTAYCVTVTDSVGCSTSACQAVKVSGPMNVNAGTASTISDCPNAYATLGGTPVISGSPGNYTYSWTPTTGLDSPQIANPRVHNLTTTTLYTLVVTNLTTGCSGTGQVLVTVIPSDLSANAGPDQSLCYNDHTGIQIGGIPTATGGLTPYTYSWGPAAGLSSTTAANPIASPSASTTYVLNVTDALGCTISDSVNVTVVQRAPVAISGLSPKYCMNAANVSLTGFPAGGTFSGPGVTGNIFNPSSIGTGNWCINYTYSDPVSGCTSDTTVCVVVDSVPVPVISGYSGTYCHLDSAIRLTAVPAGGAFSGPGMSGDIFTPANANTGANIITYTYIDTLLGCSNSTQFTININPVPVMTIAASDSLVCPGSNVSLSAQYSTDVFNIAWSDLSGSIIYSGLNAFVVSPSIPNHCYTATAVNTSGCLTRDTICIGLLDCYIKAVDEPCDADSVYINNPITISVLNIDTIPAGNDTIITIRTIPMSGSVTVNDNHTITYVPPADYAGNAEFAYQVCVVVKGFSVCDTADVCITIVDTTIHCHFPNTITPNNDGINDEFVISCNDEYPAAEVRIYDRWGAEVYRSMGHYNNDWSGVNQQGVRVPDGTYFYMYYFNDGNNRMKAGFVDVYR